MSDPSFAEPDSEPPSLGRILLIDEELIALQCQIDRLLDERAAIVRANLAAKGKGKTGPAERAAARGAAAQASRARAPPPEAPPPEAGADETAEPEAETLPEALGWRAPTPGEKQRGPWYAVWHLDDPLQEIRGLNGGPGAWQVILESIPGGEYRSGRDALRNPRVAFDETCEIYRRGASRWRAPLPPPVRWWA